MAEDDVRIDPLVSRSAATPAAWDLVTFSTDVANMPAPTQLAYRAGRIEIRGSGVAVANTQRRDVWLIPGLPAHRNGWVRSVWWGRQGGAGPAGTPATIRPQHGHFHRVGVDPATGRPTGIAVWHDILFGIFSLLNLNTWRAGATDTALDQGSGSLLLGTVAVAASQRTANVVTLTVPTSAPYRAGDLIQVNVAVGAFDGVFVVTAVTPTTIVYGQVGGDAAGGAGTAFPPASPLNSNAIDAIARSAAVSACSRTDQVVTFVVPAGHPFSQGDNITVDVAVAGYDGVYTVVAVTDTTVVTHQAAANDAAGGAGTLTKTFPYVVESVVMENFLYASAAPLRPAVSSTAPGSFALGSTGDAKSTIAVDLGPIVDVPILPLGRSGVLAAHCCSLQAGSCRYDNLSAGVFR